MIKSVTETLANVPKRHRSVIERRARRIIAEHVRKRGEEDAKSSKAGTRVYNH